MFNKEPNGFVVASSILSSSLFIISKSESSPVDNKVKILFLQPTKYSWINTRCAHIKHCVYIKLEFVVLLLPISFGKNLKMMMKFQFSPKMDYYAPPLGNGSNLLMWLFFALSSSEFRWKFHAVIISHCRLKYLNPSKRIIYFSLSRMWW